MLAGRAAAVPIPSVSPLDRPGNHRAISGNKTGASSGSGGSGSSGRYEGEADWRKEVRKQNEDEDEDGHSFLQALKVSYTYTKADVIRRPRNTFIGIAAVFLLVFFSGAVIVGIWKAPYVLLRLSELTSGEMDIILYGGGNTPFIDFPSVNKRVSRSADVYGSAPRWILRAEMTAATTRLSDIVNPTDNTSRLSSTSVNVLLIDSELEKTAGVGRGWPYRQIGYAEAQVYYSAAEYVGLRPNIGQRFSLTIDAATALSTAGLSAADLQIPVTRPTNITTALDFYLLSFFELNNITDDSFNALEVVTGSLGLTMTDAIAKANGKYTTVLGNVVLLDYHDLPQVLLAQSCLAGPQLLQPAPGYYFPTVADLFNISVNLDNFDLARYALLMVTMLNGRYDMYYSETNSRNRIMTEKSNSLMRAVGLDFDGSIEFPLAIALETFDTFKVLLTSSFVIVVVCIVVLGGILMFALLRINAEERQFELAMIRAQGMPQKQIAGVLLAQTLAFTIPGTGLGVALVAVVNAILEAALASFTKAPARPGKLPVAAAVICVLLGLILPLVATWGPVRRALGGSLRDALDVYRQVQNETQVMAIKLEEIGLETWQVILGFFLVVAGFMIYYLMPLSFIFSNMMLFFVLLDIILICMVVGLCMILYVAEPFAEQGILYLLLWGPERKLRTLILKNLRSHRERNSKAYMTFLMSVGSLTAAGVMFAVLATISSQITELTAGAPVTVRSTSIDYPLDRAELDAFLRTEGAAVARSWAYSSFNLRLYPQITSNTRVGNVVGNSRSIGVTAVTETFMEATYKDYNVVDSYNERYQYPINANGRKDVVQSMYLYPPAPTDDDDANKNTQQADDDLVLVSGLPDGYPQPNVSGKRRYRIPMMITAAAKDELGMDVNAYAQLTYTYAIAPSRLVGTQFDLEPRAMMDRVSGFFAISSLPILFTSGSILVPETYFRMLLNPVPLDFDNESDVELRSGALTDVRYEVIYIQLHGRVSKKQRETFVNALQAHTNTLYHTTVDSQSVVDDLQAVQNLIMYFFYFTAVICILLCAFMMWLTFISNVQLHAWTFGVLRSLGFHVAQLMRAAIYEALCIVISAFVFGLVVGIIVGLTLSLQLSGFMILPFQFKVPYPLIIIVLGLALIAAVVGSILPFRTIRKKAIASVLRGA